MFTDNDELKFSLSSYVSDQKVPRMEFRSCTGDSIQKTIWTASADETVQEPEDEVFSPMTHVFFHIGWVFLALGIVIMVASPFLVPNPWVGVMTTVALIIGASGIRGCILLARKDESKPNQ